MCPENSSSRRSGKPSPESIRQSVQAYIDGVIDGSIVIGKLVRLCVQRHVRDSVDGEARGCVDEEAAIRVIRFFALL